MSINHISSDLPETLWWRQHQQQEFMMNEPTPNTSNSSKHNSFFTPHQNHHHHHRNNHHQLWLLQNQNQNQNPTFNNLNLNQLDNEDEPEEQITDELITDITKEEERHQLLQKEFMFEKPLTPSDVGKLNRLVIPKQHAEKYFPLGGGSTGGDSGLLLSFEDELGKCWRFRYSYWNSSQSYVLTKGWSRFVKEKRLDAGDVVFFERHRTELDRFFIGWRRRESAVEAQSGGCADDNSGGGGSGWTRVFYSAHPYPSHPLPYQPDHCLHAGSIGQNQTTPVGNSKRLRLFGVNLECQLDESSEPPTPHGSSLSSLAQAPYEYYTESHGATHHNYTQDMNFTGDVNQMINRRG